MSSANVNPARHAAGSVHLKIHRRGNTLRAVISGPRLGERESQIVARELHEAIRAIGRRMKHLVLDLNNVHTMSSLGLGMCIDVRNAARKLGADTIVIGLNQELTDLFRMMKVDRLYVIVQDEEALQRKLSG